MKPCYWNCPYFNTESKHMECLHPQAESKDIITWSVEDNILESVPVRCPLKGDLNENGYRKITTS